MGQRTCSIEGCERKHFARGWCRAHYERWWRTGEPGEHPIDQRVSGSPWERLLAKVDVNGPVAKNRPDLGRCWMWTASRVERGYAFLSVDGRHVPAHRVAYEHCYGPIPDGLILDHFACDNGQAGCVNPDHVRPATYRENNRRGGSPSGINAAKTHCIHGHPLSGENLRMRSGPENGRRRCVACHRIANAAYRQRLRAS
jgi:hypothetical protein